MRARLRANGTPATLTLAGDGEEIETLKVQIQRLGLGEAARFIGHVKARFGFTKGRLLVVPSRGDSMPYVVIEAAAAGIPMLAAMLAAFPKFSRRIPKPVRRQQCERHGRCDCSRTPGAHDRSGARPIAARKNSGIFPSRPWSRACWQATATRLPSLTVVYQR